MVDYIVTTKDGVFVREGDHIVSSSGRIGEFGGVTRGPGYNGTAKVLINGAEYYASAWGLDVEEIDDEPDFDEVEDEEEEDWLDYEDFFAEDDEDYDREWPDLF